MPSPERIENLVARLALATKERQLSKIEAKERFDLYWRALSDVPLPDLAKAFDQILKTATFMPTPGEVRTIASRHTALRSFRESRARHLVWLHENKWQAPIAEEDLVRPEDIAAIKEQVAKQFPSNRDAGSEAA